jgi:branched-chain amino acid transport system permease protein
MGFLASIASIVLVYSIASIAAGFYCGRLRITPICHGMVLGIGAYTWAVLSKHGFSPLWVIAAVSIASVLSGCTVVALSELAVANDFSILSFSLQILWLGIMVNLVNLTNGALGISGIPPILPAHILPPIVSGNICALILMATVVALTNYTARSPFMIAVAVVARSSELAWSLGINPLAVRLQMGAFYGLFAGLAGAVWASYVSFVSPDLYDVSTSVSILAISYFVERNGWLGGIFGSILVVGTPELARLIGLNSTKAGFLQWLLSGLLIALGPMLGYARGPKWKQILLRTQL